MIISLMSQQSFDYIFLTYTPHFCRTNGHNISMLQNFMEATKNDAYNQRVRRANSKLFKPIIGQIITIENGNRKSFERFLNDVRKIDKT